MSKYLFTLIISITTFVFFSCEEDVEPDNNQNNNQSMSELILGCWELDSVRRNLETWTPPYSHCDYWCFTSDSIRSYYRDNPESNFDIENSHYYLDDFIDILYNDVDHIGEYNTYRIRSLTNDFFLIEEFGENPYTGIQYVSDSIYFSKVESIVWLTTTEG